MERTILWRIDAEPVLRHFARRCALDVAHLWDMPAVMRRYLETGDETLRDAAWDAQNRRLVAMVMAEHRRTK